MSFRKISAIVMPLILIGYVGTETWMKLNHSSMCEATGCKMADSLLNFNGIYLDFLGITAGMLMLVTAILWAKHEVFKPLFFVSLYSAIAFETVMIGFQAFANPEMCKFCLGVYSILLLTAFLTERRYLLYAAPAIIAVFAALSTLSIPKNTPIVTKEGIYLIHSEKCPHCKKVKAFFKDENISYYSIAISNPNARMTATTLGITQIPIAIIKKDNKIEILRGDRDIIGYFKKAPAKEESNQNEESESMNMPLRESDIYANPDEGGCSLSPLQESSCEKGSN